MGQKVGSDDDGCSPRSVEVESSTARLRWSRLALLAVLVLLGVCGTATNASALPYFQVTAPTGSPKGVIILIHGGGWVNVGASLLPALNPQVSQFVADGWETVNTDYSPLAGSLPDVQAVFDATRSRVGSSVPICVYGQSTGGNLALLLAESRPVSCVIDAAGPSDLGAVESLNLDYYVDQLEGAGVSDAAWSPALQASQNLAVPTIAEYANNDWMVPLAQGQELQADDPSHVTLITLDGGSASFIHSTVDQGELTTAHAREDQLLASVGGGSQGGGTGGTGGPGGGGVTAQLSYPTADQIGVDVSRPFAWSGVAGAQGYLLTVGTSLGGYDLLNSGVLSSGTSSYRVPGLPSGKTLYARIYTEVGGSWTYEDVAFTAAASSTNTAQLTYPAAGATGIGTSPTFTWSGVAGAQDYVLTVGTTLGGYDVANSGMLTGGTSSYTASGLPAGKTLYARLYTLVNGAWTDQDVTFTTAGTGGTGGGGATARLSYPTADEIGVDVSRPFAWSSVAGAQGYLLTVGSSLGGYDLLNSGVLSSGTSSYQVSGLPSGKTLYARIYTEVGGSWTYEDVTFTVAAASSANTAQLTYPAAGGTGIGSSPTFTWTGVAGAQDYVLTVGTTLGGYDVANSGMLAGTATSYTASGLPAGKTLYARLYTLVNGTWTDEDISFTTAG